MNDGPIISPRIRRQRRKRILRTLIRLVAALGVWMLVQYIRNPPPAAAAAEQQPLVEYKTAPMGVVGFLQFVIVLVGLVKFQMVMNGSSD